MDGSKVIRCVNALGVTALAGLLLLPAAAGGGRAQPAPADLFVSTSGSDGGRCTQDAPCLTFDRANRVAKSGDVVEVADGRYGEQSLRAIGGSRTEKVVFRPAAGASVAIGGLNVDASWVSFQNMTLEDDWKTSSSTSNVSFVNLTVHGAIFINSSSNISVIGGSVGPGTDFHPQIAAWPIGTQAKNILISGVYFHDWRASRSGVHTQCLLVGSALGITIRNSVFHNCAVFDLAFTNFNGGIVRDVLVENNVFDTSVDGGFYSLSFFGDPAYDWRNVLVRYNTAGQAMQFALGSSSLSNFRVVGNIGPQRTGECNSRIQYSHNVGPTSSAGRPIAGRRESSTGSSERGC